MKEIKIHTPVIVRVNGKEVSGFCKTSFTTDMYGNYLCIAYLSFLDLPFTITAVNNIIYYNFTAPALVDDGTHTAPTGRMINLSTNQIPKMQEVDEIQMLIGCRNSMEISLKGEDPTSSYRGLEEFFVELGTDDFIRFHRSGVIRKSHILMVTGGKKPTLLTKDGKTCAISAAYKKDMMKCFEQLLKEITGKMPGAALLCS